MLHSYNHTQYDLFLHALTVKISPAVSRFLLSLSSRHLSRRILAADDEPRRRGRRLVGLRNTLTPRRLLHRPISANPPKAPTKRFAPLISYALASKSSQYSMHDHLQLIQIFRARVRYSARNAMTTRANFNPIDTEIHYTRTFIFYM